MRRGPVALLAGATLVAGCGSTPLSVTQLRNSATQICESATRQAGRIPSPSSPSRSVAFLRSGARIMSYELRGLRALRPPGSLSALYASTVRDFSQQLNFVEQSVQQMAHGEDPVITVKLLQGQLGPIESKEQTEWDGLGVPACTAQQ